MVLHLVGHIRIAYPDTLRRLFGDASSSDNLFDFWQMLDSDKRSSVLEIKTTQSSRSSSCYFEIAI